MAPPAPEKNKKDKAKTKDKKAKGKEPEKKDKNQMKQSGARTDAFIGSRDVLSLTAHNIADYLAEKDIALVMFYDPTDAMCEWSKKHFLKAAKTTVRENHAFAAVNCVLQHELCKSENVETVPYFKLYSKAKVLAEYGKPKEFIFHTMKKFVENAPILTESTRPKRPCD